MSKTFYGYILRDGTVYISQQPLQGVDFGDSHPLVAISLGEVIANNKDEAEEKFKAIFKERMSKIMNKGKEE